MNIEVSVGEVIDKLTILQIKSERVSDMEKIANINKEYDYLYNAVVSEMGMMILVSPKYQELYQTNISLWDIEDAIRVKEKNKEFDDEFIKLARDVYRTNDERAAIKKAINTQYKSIFVEEKSYEQY